eukprot:2602937-Pyramimonas_sp.AAC.1
MMRAASAGSRSSGRSLPSPSARRGPAPPTSSSGLGRRMLLKGTRPSPSSCTYAIGACPAHRAGEYPHVHERSVSPTPSGESR